MGYIPFYEICSNIEDGGTMALNVKSEDNEFGLPMDKYIFYELYCNECDCHRVMFYVMCSKMKVPVAVICWGWKSRNFYKKLYKNVSKEVMDEIKGPALDSLNPQSVLAPRILKMFKEILMTDPNYTEEIKTHFKMFKKNLKKKKSLENNSAVG